MQVGSPIEIYQKPNSEFIAKFIGRANILKATIVSKEDRKMKIKLLGSEYIVDSEAEYGVGEIVEVVVRPESIKFNSHKHHGKVVKSVFMGENHEYEIMVEDEKIEVSLNNPHGKEIRKVGENLTFVFDEESIHII